MRLPALLFCVAFCNVAVASSLDELERRAVEAALEGRIATLDASELEHRLHAARAEGGPEFFAGAGVGRVREPVTAEVIRDYERASMHVGVRVPLLGAREARERRVTALETEHERALVRRTQVADEIRHRVRLSYVDYLRATERARLAQAFLFIRTNVEPLLERRKRGNLLLEVDRLGYMSMFDTARRNMLREQAAGDRKLAQLRRMTGEELDLLSATPPMLATSCLMPDKVIAESSLRPERQLLAHALEGQRRLKPQQQWVGVQANIALSQAVTQDFGAERGHSTVLGVDVTVPLSVGRLRDARRAEHIAAMTRSELMLEQQQRIYIATVEGAFADLNASDQDVRTARRKFEVAEEGVRVAALRARHLEGDTAERALQARYALYLAAVEYSESLQRHERAQAGLLALTVPCESPTVQPALHLAPAVIATLSAPLDAQPAQRAQALDWFVWEAEALLDDPALLDRVPAHSRRLLLSFTGAQLQSFNARVESRRLHALLDAAHARGLRVDLLLGEPTWVLPEHRPQLVAVIRSLRGYAFDGVNLDLERNQLPHAQQTEWETNALATLRAVARHSALRITLTTHYREFENEDFTRALSIAGVSEIMPMIYIANGQRVIAITTAIARIDSALRLTVAQSMEPELPATESLHGVGQVAAKAHWVALSQALGSQPNFGGIAVQSLDTYLKARP